MVRTARLGDGRVWAGGGGRVHLGPLHCPTHTFADTHQVRMGQVDMHTTQAQVKRSKSVDETGFFGAKETLEQEFDWDEV